MKTKTQLLVELWTEARTRFTNQLVNLTEEDLKKRLPPSVNSVGFLMRHIGDVELLFAKNVFGAKSVKVTAKTVIAHTDTGEWTNLEELKTYVTDSFEYLESHSNGTIRCRLGNYAYHQRIRYQDQSGGLRSNHIPHQSPRGADGSIGQIWKIELFGFCYSKTIPIDCLKTRQPTDYLKPLRQSCFPDQEVQFTSIDSPVADH